MFKEKLTQALPDEFILESSQLDSFELYLSELMRWNQKVRLVSKSDESRLIQRHVIESLVLLDVGLVPAAGKILDLGTGGGFPGIPLKIALPKLKLTLLDSRRSKTLFLQDIVKKLKWNEVKVTCNRAEKLKSEISNEYDCVVARAVSNLKNLWEWSEPLLSSGGYLLAQKGGEVDREIDELKKVYSNIEIMKIEYDKKWGVDQSRFVIAIKRENE